MIRAQNLTGREFQNVQREMAAVQGQAATVSGAFGAAANGAASLALRLGLLPGLFGAFSVAAAMGMQTALAHIQAMTGASAASTQRLGRAAMSLAATYGVSSEKIVKSAYDVYSAGFKEKEALDILRAGTKAAAAAHENLDGTMKALTTTMVDFPRGFKNADDAAGQMMKTIQLGRMTLDAYDHSIATAEPLAAKLGVSYQQLGAMLVMLTRHGNTAAESNQMIRNSMTTLINPTLQMRNAASSLHTQWQTLYGHGKNLITTMRAIYDASKLGALSEREIADATGMHGVRAEKLFETMHNGVSKLKALAGSQLAYNTILQTVAGEGYKQIQDAQEKIANGADALNRAWDIAGATTAQKAEILRQNFHNLAIQTGTALLPALKALLMILTPMAAAMAHLAGQHHTLVVAIVGLGVATLALGAALKVVGGAVTLYTQSWQIARGVHDAVARGMSLLTEAGRAQAAEEEMRRGKVDLSTAAQKRAEAQAILTGRAHRGEAINLREVAAADEALGVKMKAATAAQARSEIASRKVADANKEVRDSTLAVMAAERDREAAAGAYQAAMSGKINAAHNLETAQNGLKIATANVSVAEETLALRGRELDAALEAEAVKGSSLEEAMIACRGETTAFAAAQEDLTLKTQLQEVAAGRVGSAWRGTKDAEIELAAASEGLKAKTEALTVAQAAQNAKVAICNFLMIGAAAAETEATVATDALAGGMVALDAAEAPAVAETGLLAVAMAALELPLWAVVVAIVAIIAVFVLLYNYFPPFRDAVNAVADALSRLADAIGQKVMFALNLLRDVAGQVGNKLDFLASKLGITKGDFLALIPVIGPVILALEHLGQIAHWTGDAFGWIGSKISGLNDWINQHTPSWLRLDRAVIATGNDMARVGSQMDGYDRKHQHMKQSVDDNRLALERHKAALGADGEQADAAAEQVARAELKFQQGRDAIIAIIESMRNRGKAAWKDLVDHTKNAFADMEATARAHTHSTVAGVLKDIKDLEKMMPQRIVLPRLYVDPSVLPIPNKARPDAAVDTKPSAEIMQALGQTEQKLIGQLAALPPQFKSVGDAIVAAYKTQIKAAHDDFIAKLKTENVRHATALNSIYERARAGEAAAVQRANTERSTLDRSYLAQLTSLQTAHQARVEAFHSSLQIRYQTMLASFLSAFQGIMTRRADAEAAYNARLKEVYSEYLMKLSQAHGKYAEQQRQNDEQWYAKRLAAEAVSYANSVKLMGVAAAQRAADYKNQANELKRVGDSWIEADKRWFREQNTRINEGYRHHAASIQTTLNNHLAGLNRTMITSVDRENAAHRAHVAALEAAFRRHASAIEKSMKTAAAPAGLWDKVKQAADDLANNALKRLALAFLEHRGHIAQLTQEVIKARQAQATLTRAENQAEAQVYRTIHGHEDYQKALQKVTDALDKQMAQAVAKTVLDLMRHSGAVKADEAEVRRLAEQQKRYADQQAKVQKIIDSIMNPAKKHMDDFVAQLDKIKNAIDQKLNAAVAKYELALLSGKGNLDKLGAAIDRAALKSERFAQVQDAAATRLADAQLRAAQKAGDFARIFDLVSQKTQKAVTDATNAFVGGLLSGSRNMAGLAVNLYRAAYNSQMLAEKEQQAQAIVTQAEIKAARAAGDLATAFDKSKNLIDSRLNTALARAAQEFLDTGRISAQTTAGLQRLAMEQARYNLALEKAQAIVNALDTSFQGLQNRLQKVAQEDMEAYARALYEISQGAHYSAQQLEQLRQAAFRSASQSNLLAINEEKVNRQLQEQMLLQNGDFNSLHQHAQMLYEDAMAAYEDAMAHHASAETLRHLRQAADDAAKGLMELDAVAKQAEADITGDTGYGADTKQSGGLTDYQQFEEQFKEQQLAEKTQNDLSKQQLAQQKLADQQAKQEQQQQQNQAKQQQAALQAQIDIQKQQLAILQQQLNVANQTLELQSRMLYLSRLGLSRIMVGSTQGLLNSFGGQMFANRSSR